MLKFIVRSIIGTAMIFSAVCGARAEDDVQVIVDPDESVAGHTQLFWAEAWWQWALSITAAKNPIGDTTGAFAAIGNNGPIFFLAGTSGSPGSTTRTITVPYGKPVFFPIVNGFSAAIGATGKFDPTPCKTPLTVSCELTQVPGPISKAKNMMVTIDTKTINIITHREEEDGNKFRQTSTSFFVIFLPVDNLFGLPPAYYFLGQPVTVQDGYYVMLNNLSLGTHTLHFHGEIPPIPNLGLLKFTGDVTDTLNVVVAP